MNRRLLSSLIVILVLASSPVRAQLLPVTTSSQEARERFELGRHAAFHYQDAQALEHLDAAIAADSTFVLAYLHRGGMSPHFERKPYFDLAVKHRSEVSEDEQRMIDAFFGFLWDGDVDRAVGIFRELSDKYMDDPYLPTYLGLRYLRNLGRYDDAREQFQRAVTRDPSFSQGYNWLGYVALAQEDYAAAEEAFQKYVELAPDQPRPYDSLGELYVRTGHEEDAVRHFELALSRFPGFVESSEKLARIHIGRVNVRFEQAVARKDATAMASLYHERGQLLPDGSGIIEGTEAIRQFWQGIFDAGITAADLETSEVYLGAGGYFATEIGHYGLRAGDAEADAGKYVVLWYRRPEGWVLYRDMWTSDGPSEN